MAILEQIRKVSFIDVLVVVLAFIACGMMTGPVVLKQMEAKNIRTAHEEVSFIADHLQAVQEDLLASKREPASVESQLEHEVKEYEKQVDPWGARYHLELVHNSYGQFVGAAVWSLGPNGQQDTPDAAIHEGVAAGEIHFQADDIGSVFSRK